jgi:antitoxin MazE
MLVQLKKWGNSQGIRIPKHILEEALLNENDYVELIIKDGGIFLKRNEQKHVPLKERIKNYNGNYKVSEWNTGKNIGKEVF